MARVSPDACLTEDGVQAPRLAGGLGLVASVRSIRRQFQAQSLRPSPFPNVCVVSCRTSGERTSGERTSASLASPPGIIRILIQEGKKQTVILRGRLQLSGPSSHKHEAAPRQDQGITVISRFKYRTSAFDWLHKAKALRSLRSLRCANAPCIPVRGMDVITV